MRWLAIVAFSGDLPESDIEGGVEALRKAGLIVNVMSKNLRRYLGFYHRDRIVEAIIDTQVGADSKPPTKIIEEIEDMVKPFGGQIDGQYWLIDDDHVPFAHLAEWVARAARYPSGPFQRHVRRRAGNRGFHLIVISRWSREGKRREALGIGPCMLIDHECVHLFAASMKEIDDYLEAFPERATLVHDRQNMRLRASGLSELEAMLTGGGTRREDHWQPPAIDDDDDGPEVVD